MEIDKDFRNELLKRREVGFAFSAEKNPGSDFARKKVAEKFKVGEEKIAVKLLKNNFGSNDFLVEAFVYDSANDLLMIEPKKKEKKGAGGA
jgi:ribosomal protein S24E